MKLTDKVVFISGASKGIGAVAARQFAAREAKVVLAARTSDLLDRGCRAILDSGADAFAVELDITSDASVEQAVSAALTHYGRIDVLINNAGNGGRLGSLAERPVGDTRDMFDVHVFGTERMVRAVLPSMLDLGEGRIVNIVSTVGYVPMPGAAACCAAKAAVIALTRSLQGELAHTGVELALFSPPHTQTEAGRDWPLGLPKDFSPEFAAEALLRSVMKDRREVLAGGNNTLLWLQRLSPAWADRIMRNIGLEATRKARALGVNYGAAAHSPPADSLV